MRRTARIVVTTLPLAALSLLSACGGSSNSDTVSVLCGGSLTLAGARSVTVEANAQNGGAMLHFPDPARSGEQGTLPLKPGDRCTIRQTRRVGS